MKSKRGRKSNEEIVLNKVWDAVQQEAKRRKILPIKYKKLREWHPEINEYFDMKVFGMPAKVHMRDLGCHEVITHISINPPPYVDKCPPGYYDLPRRSKIVDLLHLEIWTRREEENEPYKPWFYRDVRGSIETFRKILTA